MPFRYCRRDTLSSHLVLHLSEPQVAVLVVVSVEEHHV